MSREYTATEILKVSVAATSLCFGAQDNILSVGSADGSLRLYNLPSVKVIKAIRQLGDEVSSVVWSVPYESDKGEIWVASGRKVYNFEWNNSSKMIQSPQDARLSLDLGEDEEDVLNELNVNESKKYLAFSTDAGTVGIVDIATRQIHRMKTRHTSICGSVKFVPDRNSELVSGGYDSALLHFDFTQRSILSRYDLAASQPTSGVSLSPPFVLSISVSSTGLIAAGTADGRLWLGAGGDKTAPSLPGARKKRSRKWEGLKESEGQLFQIAEGPVVAVAFSGQKTLITSTLLGKLMMHEVSYDDNGKVQLVTVWNAETKEVAKVNTIVVNDRWFAIGGLGNDNKGVVEIWASRPESDTPQTDQK